MDFNFSQERDLESKYQGVLAYVEAKEFLRETPYTAQKIAGAMKRFEKSEGAEKPTTFSEMEAYVSDLMDFWLDANPNDHAGGEITLRNSVANYVAYSVVWKVKARRSAILSPDLMGTVGQWLAARSALASMSMIIPSMAKRLGDGKDSYIEFKTDLPYIYQTLYAAGSQIVQGKLELPESETQQDLARLIGAFYAGDPGVLLATESLKMIEHKENAA